MSRLKKTDSGSSAGVTHALKVSAPNTWQVVPLEEVLEQIVGGGTPSRNNPDYWSGSIPWLTVKDMRTRRPEDSIDHISEEAVQDSATNIIPADTVIIATRIGLGKVVRVPYESAINQDLKALIAKPIVDKSYLEYWIYSIANYLESIGSGTTVKGIRLEQVRSLPFPLAPFEQQKSIVGEIEKQFSRLDEAVANLKRVKANLKRYKAAVLKAAVEGKLTEEWRKAHPDVEPASKLLDRILTERRAKWEEAELAKMEAKGKAPKNDKWKTKYKEPGSPDASGLPELPDGWQWSNFETAAERVTVGHVGSMKDEYIEDGVPFLRSQNVRPNRYDPEGLKYISEQFHRQLSKSILKPGDIVVVRSGSVGVSCVIPEQLTEANCSDLVIIKAPRAVLPAFGAYYMNSVVETRVAAGKVGVALTHFNTQSVAELPLPVPPIAEQHQIVAEVERKLSLADESDVQVDANLKRADLLRQSILEKAFSGQLVPENPNAEPASELLKRIREHVKPKRAKQTRKTRTTKPVGKESAVTNLLEALQNADEWVNAQEAFRRCGVGDGADTDAIERMYSDLRGYIRSGLIEVERRDEADWLRAFQQQGG